jgi:hypothetical protein
VRVPLTAITGLESHKDHAAPFHARPQDVTGSSRKCVDNFGPIPCHLVTAWRILCHKPSQGGVQHGSAGSRRRSEALNSRIPVPDRSLLVKIVITVSGSSCVTALATLIAASAQLLPNHVGVGSVVVAVAAIAGGRLMDNSPGTPAA